MPCFPGKSVIEVVWPDLGSREAFAQIARLHEWGRNLDFGELALSCKLSFETRSAQTLPLDPGLCTYRRSEAL